MKALKIDNQTYKFIELFSMQKNVSKSKVTRMLIEKGIESIEQKEGITNGQIISC